MNLFLDDSITLVDWFEIGFENISSTCLQYQWNNIKPIITIFRLGCKEQENKYNLPFE
jgi:hypothetical protein